MNRFLNNINGNFRGFSVVELYKPLHEWVHLQPKTLITLQKITFKQLLLWYTVLQVTEQLVMFIVLLFAYCRVCWGVLGPPLNHKLLGPRLNWEDHPSSFYILPAPRLPVFLFVCMFVKNQINQSEDEIYCHNSWITLLIYPRHFLLLTHSALYTGYPHLQRFRILFM